MDNTCYKCQKNAPGKYYTLYYGIPKGKSSSGNYQYTTVTTSYAIQELTNYYCDDCVKKKMRISLSIFVLLILMSIAHFFLLLLPAFIIIDGNRPSELAYLKKINQLIEPHPILMCTVFAMILFLFVFCIIIWVIYALRKGELMAVIMMLQNKKRLKKSYGDDILIRTPADYKSLKKSNLKTYGK